MKSLLALVLALPLVASAHGSSHPKAADTGGTFVPIEQAGRTMHFTSSRIWQNTAGEILVCPLDAVVENWRERICVRRDKNAWIPMTSLKIEGYEISGFSNFFVGTGGDHQLLVHFRKVVPPVPQVTPAPPAPAQTVLNVGTLTIQAGRVLVQRRK